MRVLVLAAGATVAGLMMAASVDAATITYVATLSGSAEEPPNDSPGTGSSVLTVDTTARTYQIEATFSGLVAPTTVAHIHGPTVDPGVGTAGVMTTVPSFPDFPLDVTSGSYDRVFDLTDLATYNPAFVDASGGLEAAEAAFLAALDTGRAYLNIHSTAYPAGEIRGFYEPAPAPIPLPAGLPLLALALAGLGLARLGRRVGA